MGGIAVHVQHGHGDFVAVKHGKEAAKEVRVVGRETMLRAVFNGWC